VVNLLSSKSPRPPFPAFDEEQRARFEERARFLLRFAWPEDSRTLALELDAYALEFEELESEPSLAAAEALLAQIDELRRARVAPSKDPAGTTPRSLGGEWFCYWPGQSLSTGEAEIASRGFFDIRDRPPVGLWVETLGRKRGGASRAYEVAVLCWIPPAVAESAWAGRRACASGCLSGLAEVSDALCDQIRGLDRALAVDSR
jgi:hypothetical protein